MKTQARPIGPLTIAATYVGTVVGAGFATGQEVLQFFTAFGIGGIWGALLATVLFALLGATILRLGQELQAGSHVEIVNRATGRVVGRLLDWVITFFLFGGSAVMMAGAGAVFGEHFGLPPLLGSGLLALLAVGTVLLGLRGVVTSIAVVAPVLIGLVAIVSMSAIWRQGLGPAQLAWQDIASAPVRWWPVSAVLYVSYNLILSVGVLGPLGREVTDAGALRWGGRIGGIALGLAALLIHLALLAGTPLTATFEVPMLYLARLFPAWLGFLYTIVLWAEIYTTAVASLFGLAVRFREPGRAGFRPFVIVSTILALGLSQFGFSTLVSVLFPVVGWLGLALVAGLLWQQVRRVVR